MMQYQQVGSKTGSAFISTREMVRSLSLQESLIRMAQSVAEAAGFEIGVRLYEGIGLNDRRSIYCDFDGKNTPFRMYFEIITNKRQGLDVFITDINIPTEMRGRGLGSRIICQLLGVLFTHNIGKIILNPVNGRAENFWKQFGFKTIAGRKIMSLNLGETGHVSRCTTLLINNLKKMTA